MNSEVLQRVVRRETHSPRTIATLLVLLMVIAVTLYLMIETILDLSGVAPLIEQPQAMIAALTDLQALNSGAVIGVAVGVSILGAVALFLGIAPGRRAKHQLALGSHAVVVDNEVVASAVAAEVRNEFDLSRDAVMVGVAHRSVDVVVTPGFGQTVNAQAIENFARILLGEYCLVPEVKISVKVAQTGERGSER